MYRAPVCKFVRLLLKHVTSYSDILFNKSMMTSPPNSVTSAARDHMAVPEWLFERKRKKELTLRYCSI